MKKRKGGKSTDVRLVVLLVVALVVIMALMLLDGNKGLDLLSASARKKELAAAVLIIATGIAMWIEQYSNKKHFKL